MLRAASMSSECCCQRRGVRGGGASPYTGENARASGARATCDARKGRAVSSRLHFTALNCSFTADRVPFIGADRHQGFGAGESDRSGYFLQRYVLHADMHVGGHVRAFAQLQSGIESGRPGGPRRAMRISSESTRRSPIRRERAHRARRSPGTGGRDVASHLGAGEPQYPAVLRCTAPD